MGTVFTASSDGAFSPGFDLWTSMVYHVAPGVATAHECSSVCLVAAGPCHFFYHLGTDCYMGRFDHFGGGVLSWRPGPFYYLAPEFGKSTFFNRNASPRLIPYSPQTP